MQDFQARSECGLTSKSSITFLHRFFAHLVELKKIIPAEGVTLEDGLKAVAIGQAAELSIKEKRVVSLNELLD